VRSHAGAVGLVAAALFGCSTPSAHAQPRAAAPPAAQSAPRAAPKPAAPSANLTAQQQQQIQALRVATFDQVAPLRRDLMVKRGELRSLWAAPKPDRDAILKKQAEMDEIRQKIRKAHTEERLAMTKILTPEQRAAMPPGGPGLGRGGRQGGMCGGLGGGRGMGRGRGPRGGFWD